METKLLYEIINNMLNRVSYNHNKVYKSIIDYILSNISRLI